MHFQLTPLVSLSTNAKQVVVLATKTENCDGSKFKDENKDNTQKTSLKTFLNVQSDSQVATVVNC